MTLVHMRALHGKKISSSSLKVDCLVLANSPFMASEENARRQYRVFYCVLLSRDFSRLRQMESLLAGYSKGL